MNATVASRSGSLVNIDPEILSGTPVFRGTRVPVRTLWDHLISGETLDDFLEGFPSVSRQQAEVVMNEALKLLIDNA